jgi:hypothetical protein
LATLTCPHPRSPSSPASAPRIGSTTTRREGEFLEVLLADADLLGDDSIGADAIGVPEAGELACRVLGGALKPSLWPPIDDRLDKLGVRWRKLIENNGFRRRRRAGRAAMLVVEGARTGLVVRAQ